LYKNPSKYKILTRIPKICICSARMKMEGSPISELESILVSSPDMPYPIKVNNREKMLMKYFPQ
jgi:hypothetical protein